jgi:hypothetical protein
MRDCRYRQPAIPDQMVERECTGAARDNQREQREPQDMLGPAARYHESSITIVIPKSPSAESLDARRKRRAIIGISCGSPAMPIGKRALEPVKNTEWRYAP